MGRPRRPGLAEEERIVFSWVAIAIGWLLLPVLVFVPGAGDAPVLTEFPGASASALAAAPLPGGGLVAVGKASGPAGDDVALAEFGASLALVSSFGDGGRVLTDLGSDSDVAMAVAVQPDGKIVVAGRRGAGRAGDLALLRYNSDGSLDRGFGTAGMAFLDVARDEDEARAVALDAEGRILVAGRTIGNGAAFLVARYTADGLPDSSFARHGYTAVGIGGNDEAFALALQADGHIVVAGRTSTASASDDFALVRLNPDGSRDRSFGKGGKTTLDFAGESDTAFGIGILGDGRLVLAGGAIVGGDDQIALAAFRPDGTPDAGFGSNGKSLLDAGPGSEEAFALAVGADQTITVAGGSITEPGEDLVAARFTSDGQPDVSFGSNGAIVKDVQGGIDEVRAIVSSGDRLLAAGRSTKDPAGRQSAFLLWPLPG